MATQSAFSLFNPSKDAVLRNLGTFFVLVFLPSFLIILGDTINGTNTWSFSGMPNPTAQEGGVTPFHAIGGLLSLLFLPAGYYVELQAAKGKTLDISSSFKASLQYFWRVIGLVIVMGIIIILGLLALIVPGIIFIRRYFLAPYFLVDQNLSIRESLSASAAATKGKSWAIWGVIGVIILLSLANIIPVIGGLTSLILLTLYTCAPALRYLELKPSSTTPKA